MDLSVTDREQGGVHVAAVFGEVDVHTAPELDAALTSLTDREATRLVVDLTAVDFLDSTGLSVLVKTLKHVREADGVLHVVVTAERIAKVFRITGLDQVMPLHATVDDAVAAARA